MIHQSLEVNRLNHPFYENESTQSPICRMEKELNQFSQLLRGNESIHAKRLNRVDWYTGLFMSYGVNPGGGGAKSHRVTG